MMASAIAAATPVLAAFGDVAPRGDPDGRVSVADLVLATLYLRGDETPDTFERLALDVVPGFDEPLLVTPSAFLPGGDGRLDSDDLARLRDDLLVRARLPSSPGILLRDGRRTVVAGIPWHDRALLVSPFTSRVTFALDQDVPGLTFDAATGNLELAASTAQAGLAAFGIVAEQPEGRLQARVDLAVVAPRSVATVPVGPTGGSLPVSDPQGELDGAEVVIAPGELASVTAITWAVADLDEGSGGGTPLTGTLIVAMPPGEGMRVDVSLEVSPALAAAAGGEDRLTWEALVLPIVACDSGVESPGRITSWPQWTRLPSTVSDGRLRALAVAGCPGDAVLRVAIAPAPPEACSAPADGDGVRVEVRACPAEGAFTLAAVRQRFAAAITRFRDMGYGLPDVVTIVVDELPLGRDSVIDPSAPGVVHVSRSLSPERLAIVAAHETFHVAQLATVAGPCSARVDAWRWNAFVMEGTASWMERAVLDAPDDPEPIEMLPSRRLPPLTQRSLDSLSHEAWPLFDWLATSHGITPADVFQAQPPPDLSPEGAGLAAVDDMIARGGAGSLEEAWPEFMHELNVARQATRISGVERLGLPEPRVTTVSADATEASPVVRCDVVLPHASGATWLLDVPEDLAPEAGLVLRLDAPAPIGGHLFLVATGQELREIAPGAAVALGTLRGRFALHVHDPLLADAGDVPVADLAAWIAPQALPEADSDGDGTPDEAERDAGSDPYDASSVPDETWVGAPPVEVALRGATADGQGEFETVFAAPPVSVERTGPVTEGQAQFETVVAAPPVSIARTGPVTEGQAQFEAVVAAPPVSVGRTGPVTEGQKPFETVVAAPPVSVTQESP